MFINDFETATRLQRMQDENRLIKWELSDLRETEIDDELRACLKYWILEEQHENKNKQGDFEPDFEPEARNEIEKCESDLVNWLEDTFNIQGHRESPAFDEHGMRRKREMAQPSSQRDKKKKKKSKN